MSITAEKKQAIIADFARTGNDTGSPEVHSSHWSYGYLLVRTAAMHPIRGGHSTIRVPPHLC